MLRWLSRQEEPRPSHTRARAASSVVCLFASVSPVEAAHLLLAAVPLNLRCSPVPVS